MEILSTKRIEKKRISMQEFEALIQPFNERLYRTALIMAKGPSQAKELVQKTHLAAWRGYDKVGRDSNFGAWLSGLLVRQFCSLNVTSIAN